MSSAKLGFGKIQKNLRAVAGNKKFQPALFIAGIAVVGSAFILISQAATPVTSFQAEAGSRSGNVTTVTDATASAGSAVKFGSVTSGGGIPVAADFPTRESVGPAVDPTTVYAGDCYFGNNESPKLVENVIIECEAEGGLRFAPDATGWVFRNSILRGGMFTVNQTLGDPGADTYPRAPIFTVEDSDILQTTTAAGQDRALCCGHYVVKRSAIIGTHSGLAVHNNAIIEGNFISTDGTDTHQSGGRMLRNTVLRGNTITCKPVGAGYDGSGCSAHAVFYREALGGENVPAYNLTIENNYFKRGVTASGASGGPYYATRFIDCASWTDCINIKVIGNLFSLGEGTDAGEFPFYGGNVWSGNYWTDGQPANANQSR